MSNYCFNKAVVKICAHPGFMSDEDFNNKFCSADALESMSYFIRDNGCLITHRHDFQPYFGQDFLLNLLVEMLVLHVDLKGRGTLHFLEKGMPCLERNQISPQREKLLLKALYMLMPGISDLVDHIEFDEELG